MIDLGSPQKITFSSDTEELLKQIDEALANFNKLRPLEPEVEHRIKMAFLPDRVTASLNMEGIIATRRQTLAVLDAMTVTENSSKTEQEILNALRADEHVFEMSQSNHELSETFVREINTLIEDKIGEIPGAYRPRNIVISQAAFTPPNHYDLPVLMRELVEIYNISRATPVANAVWLHNRFTYIHPFLDGNGRTGRLLQDYSLMCGGLFPTGIPTSKRDDYYDALAAADQDDWDALTQIVALRELDVIAKAYAVASERRERSKWIKILAQKANDKKTGALYKQYLVWAHKMNELRSAFECAAREFNEASEAIIIHHDNFDIVNFAAWKEICEYGYGTKTWFFSQTFQVENQRVLKYVFYFRRHKNLPCDLFSYSQKAVSLFVTGGSYDDKYEFTGRYSDPEIRLREVVILHEETYQIFRAAESEQNAGAEKSDCQVLDNVNTAVQCFYEDIMMRKIGL